MISFDIVESIANTLIVRCCKLDLKLYTTVYTSMFPWYVFITVSSYRVDLSFKTWRCGQIDTETTIQILMIKAIV